MRHVKGQDTLCDLLFALLHTKTLSGKGFTLKVTTVFILGIRTSLLLTILVLQFEQEQFNSIKPSVSDFRDFVCSLFLKAILYDFYFIT